ncbi:GNAT family N-acetyltransferase [Streptomyces sp. PRKS01-65]|nr:peptidogalycan biosysnthesis protein [Streptomyces harenosi]NEY30958.1 GNAT family N-acetyltransferase [Streptomyces harenosi]
MNLTDENGLRIAHVDTGEALSRDWRAEHSGADLVRVTDFGPADRPRLREAGFAVKPSWLTWLAPVCASEEEFLHRMSKRSRRSARHGQRTVAARGVRVQVHAPLDAAVLDEFLDLYEDHMSRLRNGVPYARRIRDELLAAADGYFAVRATDDAGRLIGGCLCACDRTGTPAVRVRFSALAAGERDGNLVRSMYLTACQEARKRDVPLISLGSDPSLYGHVAQPGLFAFKNRFGCVPVPSQLLDPDDGSDEADLVLGLGALSDPSLVVAYTAAEPAAAPAGDWLKSLMDGAALPVPLRMEILTRDPEPDVTAYSAHYLSDVTVRVIAP